MSFPLSPIDGAIQQMEDCVNYAAKYGFSLRNLDDDKSSKPTPTADLATTVNKDDSEEPKTQNGKDDDAEACCKNNTTMTCEKFLIDPTMANWHEYCRTHQHEIDASLLSAYKAFDAGVFDEVPSRSNRKKSGNVRRGGKNPRH